MRVPLPAANITAARCIKSDHPKPLILHNYYTPIFSPIPLFNKNLIFPLIASINIKKRAHHGSLSFKYLNKYLN
jgi:hypothetical protein